MERIWISIIIPVYNAQRTLKRCLDSILASTLKEIEIILIDDGSTDNSWDIIQKYMKSDRRISGIRAAENGGPGKSRNIGISKARGEYITFVDSDDFVEKEIYKKCRSIIERSVSSPPPDLIDFNFYYVPYDGKAYPSEQNQIKKGRLLDRKYIEDNIIPAMINLDMSRDYFIENYSCNKVFRKAIIDQYNIRFDEKRFKWEDRPFIVWFLKYAHSYWSMSDYGYYYVKTPGSLSMRFDKTILNSVITNYETYVKLFGEIYDLKEGYERYWCTTFITTIADQFHNRIDRTLLEEMVNSAVQTGTVQKWFKSLKAETRLEEQMKSAVLQENVKRILWLCSKYAKERRRKDKVETMKSYIKRKLSSIKLKKNSEA